MIRKGYQIYFFGKVYMSKKAAEEALAEEKGRGSITEIEVIEDDQSIDDFYDQVEREDPGYQAAMIEALEEVYSTDWSKIPAVDTQAYLKGIFDKVDQEIAEEEALEFLQAGSKE